MDRPISGRASSWRYIFLLTLVVGSLAFMMTRQIFGQDLAYHDFADKRTLFRIPNFFDVITNVPFLIVGLAGIKYCRDSKLLSFRPAWLTLSAGVALVSVGSAYYHLNPSNQTLVWDRLPMTVGFMGLFVALLAEYVDVRLGKYLLVPALLVGFSSVLYWHWFDDLRLYYWVQGMPLLIIPFMVALFRPNYSHQIMLLIALGFYILAKIAEDYDREIFGFLQHNFSGHSLKHILSALGVLVIIAMLKSRKPLQNSLATNEVKPRNLHESTQRFGDSTKVASGDLEVEKNGHR